MSAKRLPALYRIWLQAVFPESQDRVAGQIKQPELFACINEQIVSVPVEPENPLRTAEMPVENDYGMIDGVISNGHRGEEREKAQAYTEKKSSIMERLADAQKECTERKPSEKAAPHKKSPELDDL